MVHSTKNVTEGTMPSEEKMSVDERRKYLKLVAPRYAPAIPEGAGKEEDLLGGL